MLIVHLTVYFIREDFGNILEFMNHNLDVKKIILFYLIYFLNAIHI